MDGLDHFRQDLEGNFGGNAFHLTQVLDGDKAVRKINDNRTDLDKNGVANQKRLAYLTVIPVTILPLQSKDFAAETIGEEKVGDKAAVGLKVTGPDKKEFKLYFDKESGLPVRMVATVPGFQGNEVTQETTFSDYKEMGGIKKATRIVVKRDGMPFQEQTVTEFKLLEKADPKTFSDVE
jgi:outer membrane lipoprotein-sorting protein